MKTDNYLALCLEQAAQSPLHYRHGAIIVRGGKVIGQGYNDYRRGFDGGALKTGRIAKGTFDGPAIAELKHKIKNKSKPKQTAETIPACSFVPFETMNVGGHQANTPLSMHSEMMAIHSALAASSTLASTTVSSIKPSFKLPRNSKPHARLRNERLKAYVEAVCRAALDQQATKQSGGQSQVQEWRFEAGASQPHQVGQGVSASGLAGCGSIRRGGQWRETSEEEREEWEEGVSSVRVSSSSSPTSSWEAVPFWKTAKTATATTCV